MPPIFRGAKPVELDGQFRADRSGRFVSAAKQGAQILARAIEGQAAGRPAASDMGPPGPRPWLVSSSFFGDVRGPSGPANFFAQAAQASISISRLMGQPDETFKKPREQVSGWSPPPRNNRVAQTQSQLSIGCVFNHSFRRFLVLLGIISGQAEKIPATPVFLSLRNSIGWRKCPDAVMARCLIRVAPGGRDSCESSGDGQKWSQTKRKEEECKTARSAGKSPALVKFPGQPNTGNDHNGSWPSPPANKR